MRVRFGPDFGAIDVPPGTTLLAAAGRARAPLGNACRGQGVCRACAVLVIHGGEALEPPGALERAMALTWPWRMACQTRVRAAEHIGEIELWTAHWGERPDEP